MYNGYIDLTHIFLLNQADIDIVCDLFSLRTVNSNEKWGVFVDYCFTSLSKADFRISRFSVRASFQARWMIRDFFSVASYRALPVSNSAQDNNRPLWGTKHTDSTNNTSRSLAANLGPDKGAKIRGWLEIGDTRRETRFIHTSPRNWRALIHARKPTMKSDIFLSPVIINDHCEIIVLSKQPSPPIQREITNGISGSSFKIRESFGKFLFGSERVFAISLICPASFQDSFFRAMKKLI